jgi:hypothetical protein
MSDETQRPGAGPDPDEHVVADDAAVVDRIVDGRRAVLLVGEAEVEVHVEVGLLPAGTGEGDWLRIGFTADPELTAARRAAMEERLARIRRTRRGGRFG